MENKKKVIVAGAGFAGIQAAKLLSKCNECEVTIIDRSIFSVMLPAIPDVAAGFIEDSLVKTPIKNLVNLNTTTVIEDNIESIDFKKNEIICSKDTYFYDYLILATGSDVNFFGFSPDSTENLHKLNTLEDAQIIKSAFKKYINSPGEKTAVFSGAGYTGIELAVALKEVCDYKNIPIKIVMAEIKDEILPFLDDAEKSYVEKFLNEKQIDIKTAVSVKNFDGNSVYLNNGEVFENSFFIWSAGTKLSVNIKTEGVKSLKDGRIEVNEFLQAPGFNNVFVAGDSAAVKDKKGNFVRKAVNFSFYGGIYAAKNVINSKNGNPLKKFIPFDAGWVIPLHEIGLGRMFSKITLKGKIALRLHYFMCGARNYKKNRLPFMLMAFKPNIFKTFSD